MLVTTQDSESSKDIKTMVKFIFLTTIGTYVIGTIAASKETNVQFL